jgi:hypothetical protein
VRAALERAREDYAEYYRTALHRAYLYLHLTGFAALLEAQGYDPGPVLVVRDDVRRELEEEVEDLDSFHQTAMGRLVCLIYGRTPEAEGARLRAAARAAVDPEAVRREAAREALRLVLSSLSDHGPRNGLDDEGRGHARNRG